MGELRSLQLSREQHKPRFVCADNKQIDHEKVFSCLLVVLMLACMLVMSVGAMWDEEAPGILALSYSTIPLPTPQIAPSSM